MVSREFGIHQLALEDAEHLGQRPKLDRYNSLMRPGMNVVTEPLVPYYQDVYDHVLRASEQTESLRDMLTSAMETNLSAQSNRMNLIMKLVTSWAAIIAVPTAITGFYGQNLPYPDFSHESSSPPPPPSRPSPHCCTPSSNARTGSEGRRACGTAATTV